MAGKIERMLWGLHCTLKSPWCKIYSLVRQQYWVVSWAYCWGCHVENGQLHLGLYGGGRECVIVGNILHWNPHPMSSRKIRRAFKDELEMWYFSFILAGGESSEWGQSLKQAADWVCLNLPPLLGNSLLSNVIEPNVVTYWGINSVNSLVWLELSCIITGGWTWVFKPVICFLY